MLFPLLMVANDFVCSSCNTVHANSIALQYHKRKAHQTSCVINQPLSLPFTLQRQADGLFHCSECPVTNNRPSGIQKHYKTGHPNICKPPSQEVLVNIKGQDTALACLPESGKQELELYSLQLHYLEPIRTLICLCCLQGIVLDDHHSCARPPCHDNVCLCEL